MNPLDRRSTVRCGSLPVAVAWAVLGLTLVCGLAATASAQDSGSIFQRFDTDSAAPSNWQTLFEVPVGLQPQTNVNVHELADEGVNWVVSYRPLNRVYFSRSVGYARMEWKLDNADNTDVQLVQWDLTELINFALTRSFVFSFGLGLGFMDGIINDGNGRFQHRLEPFIPVQLGFGLRLGRSWFVDAKAAESPYWGPGTVVSVARALVGVGYNY